jgi:hypothetical protein
MRIDVFFTNEKHKGCHRQATLYSIAPRHALDTDDGVIPNGQINKK